METTDMANPFGLGGGGGGDGMSEYERQRLENIKEMQGQFSDIFDDVRQSAEVFVKSTRRIVTSRGGKRKQKSNDNPNKRNKSDPSTPDIKIIRRSARIRQEKRKPTNYIEESDSDSEKKNKKNYHGSLRIKFPWSKKNVATDEAYYNALGDDDFINDDDDEDYFDYDHSKKTARRSTAPVPRLPVSKVTEEMLNNITYSSVGKQYSSDGTTCHQCRQKTLDQKSYCRYKHCRGVRGMFCGFCLGNRYGENVAEVLVNEKWACPPCRGYCNCSICRRKNGRNPTGQLAPIASAQGYKSVRHMLNNLEGEDSENNISSDSEIEDKENEQENISKDNRDNENISEDNSNKENKQENISEGNSNQENSQSIKKSNVLTDEDSELTNDNEYFSKEMVHLKTDKNIVKENPLDTNNVEQNDLNSCDNDERNSYDNGEMILNKNYKDIVLPTSSVVQ